MDMYLSQGVTARDGASVTIADMRQFVVVLVVLAWLVGLALRTAPPAGAPRFAPSSPAAGHLYAMCSGIPVPC